MAQSCADAWKMMTYLQHTAKKYDLKLHPGKAKVMTHVRGKRPNFIVVGLSSVAVLGIDEA